MSTGAHGSVVVFTRGDHPESEHRFVWCVADAAGSVLAGSSSGDERLHIFARSSVKPFQSLPAVRAGVLERFDLGDRHLAIGCGSHGGSAGHIEVVAEVLGACGLSEGDLACGPLDPLDPAAAAGLRARASYPTRITHNCSGKHALALALCRARGWPVDGYLDVRHPLELSMRAAVAEAAGSEPDELLHGTDGCGMRTFHLPLGALAAAFGRLASGGLGEDGARVVAAMRAHPELVGYQGGVDSELMRAEAGVVAKIGAEGVVGLGLPDGRGLALKVLDGASRAREPAAIALARQVLGLDAASEALDRLADPPVLNSRGEAVGGVEVRI